VSNILEPREYYKPFEYPKAYDFWLTQNQSFWLHTEINMDKDIDDWRFLLTDDEKLIIGNILKSFVQSEVLIGEYWRSVARIFTKPEIAMMSATFSGFETIHIASYAYLNETLGLTDFQAFLQDQKAMERLDRLQEMPVPFTSFHKKGTDLYDEDYYNWRKRTALSLAVFSAFGEGVALYSAFAVLLSFSVRGMMKGVGEIIEFSNRDEALHSRAGIWLFNELIKENTDIQDIKKDIYEAARMTVKAEDGFIDSVFEGRSLPNCTAYDLKQFIRQRANDQLIAIGLKRNWKNVDKAALERMSWFGYVTAADNHADFFSGRVTEYGKSGGWDEMF